MKKLRVLTMIFFSIVFCQQTNAQISINANIGNQPTWGPVGYEHVDYYYMPDVDAYYYVPRRQFIYQKGNRWIFAPGLPPRYSGYNLYNGYKVVINEPRPYLHHDIYKVKYKKYRGSREPRQIIIRDSDDERYKNNERNDNDHHDNGNRKNRGRGNGKGHGKHG